MELKASIHVSRLEVPSKNLKLEFLYYELLKHGFLIEKGLIDEITKDSKSIAACLMQLQFFCSLNHNKGHNLKSWCCISKFIDNVCEIEHDFETPSCLNLDLLALYYPDNIKNEIEIDTGVLKLKQKTYNNCFNQIKAVKSFQDLNRDILPYLSILCSNDIPIPILGRRNRIKGYSTHIKKLSMKDKDIISTSISH